MVSLSLPLLALSTLVLLSALVSGHHVAWHSGNCPDGEVGDAVCCQDRHCRDRTRNACDYDQACRWNEERQSCQLNKDHKSNVCCKGKCSKVCTALLKKECPEEYQVPARCCENTCLRNFNVTKPNHVCCNSPCAEAKKRDCPMPKQCHEMKGFSEKLSANNNGIGPRSLEAIKSLPYTGDLALYNDITGGLQSYGQILSGYGRPTSTASGTSYYSPLGYFGQPYMSPADDSDDGVEELTVDDLVLSINKVLGEDQDVDVIVDKHDTYSDPVFGKYSYLSKPFGQGIQLPSPGEYLKQIYSPNPMDQYSVGMMSYNMLQSMNPYMIFGPGKQYGGYGQQYGGYGQQYGGYSMHPSYGYGYYQPSYGYGNGYGQSGYGQGYSGYGQGGYGQGGYGQGGYGNGGYGNGGYGNGGYGNGGYGNGGYGNGGYGNGGYGNGGYGQGGYGNGGYGHGGYGHGGYGQSGYEQGGYGQSGHGQSGYSGNNRPYGSSRYPRETAPPENE